MCEEKKMTGGSPNFDSLILNSLNSPRFDISDFLKTPKECVSEEPFFSLTGFNVPPPPFNLLTPLPSFPSRRTPRIEVGGGEPDFSSLLFDSKGVDEGGACIEDTLNGELIAFDEIDADIAKDSFALFGGSGHDNLVNHSPALRTNSPCASTGSLIDRSLPRDPSSTSQLNCDSCQILRRIIHSNGVQDTKLEIHGCDGQSYHAVLQTRFCIDDGFPASFEQQMVEFPVGNAEYVKQFLLQYSLLRRKEGFLLRHDSLSTSSDAGSGLSIDSDGVVNASGSRLPKQMGHNALPDLLCTSSGVSLYLLLSLGKDILPQSLMKDMSAQKKYSVPYMGMSSRNRRAQPLEGRSYTGVEGATYDRIRQHLSILPIYVSDFSNCGYTKAGSAQLKLQRSNSMDSTDHVKSAMISAKPLKSNAAAQRERTGKLKMTDLAQHFHLPINAAAKELGICPTVLKKICRRNGMRRWPHRKIKSIERIIATLEQTIAEGAGQGDEGIRMEIAMLRNERAQLCAGLLGET